MTTPPHELPPLLEVRSLHVHFPVRAASPFSRAPKALHAVDDASFSLRRARSLGLVGESGCGKSTLARAILGLVRPTSGSILLDGIDVLSLAPRALARTRARVQIVFQDPGSSLNPRHRVRDIVAEPLRVHGRHASPPVDRADIPRRVLDLLDRCGLARDAADRFPHEFSGGQRQRLSIARALATNPELLVLDEPTSALDVSIQAQIINLLDDLRQDMGLACLFISHDLAVVHHFCDDIAVMQQGRIVEMGPSTQVIAGPRHEYTRRLLDAVPR